ncbi:MAG: DUF3078 domain-containing protein [Bacteroidota bacterium]
MKNKINIIAALLCMSIVVITKGQTSAVKDTSWKSGGLTALNFNQVNLSHWAAGGDDAISGAAFLRLFANYNKDKISWNNQLDLAYGMTKTGITRIQKNEDKIEFNSKLGRKLGSSNFFSTVLVNFKTQFAKGYTSVTDTIPVSKFMSPAYLLYSLGFDFKPSEHFSFYLSPATGKTVLINNQDIADAGTYGNEKMTIDSNGNVVHGKKTFTQAGAYFRATYKQEIMTNINLQTKLELFSNYIKNPQNISENWEVLLNMKVNKLVSVNIQTQMIYDDIIAVPIVKEVNNVSVTTTGPRLQFKEVLGLGLAYKF